jgi:hypothetical protein
LEFISGTCKLLCAPTINVFVLKKLPAKPGQIMERSLTDPLKDHSVWNFAQKPKKRRIEKL